MEVIMKFSDIDFSRIKEMMDNLSDEDKEKLNDMADQMVHKMKDSSMEESEEEEEIDFYEFLHIDPEEYSDLPVLDPIEQACDIEMYYQDEQDSDFSACILYYSKAILKLLRNYVYPIYQARLSFSMNVNTTTLFNYLQPLMIEENIHALSQAISSEHWIDLREFLQQVCMMLSRAEYDFVHYEELQTFKSLLFDEKKLLMIKEIAQ